MLRGFGRWLRTPPRPRWSWRGGAPRSPRRPSGPARVVALRFIDAWADDLQLRNEGPGGATDIVVTALLRDAAGAERRLSAALPSLGAGARYIVTLRPGADASAGRGQSRARDAGCASAGATWTATSARRGPWPAPATTSRSCPIPHPADRRARRLHEAQCL